MRVILALAAIVLGPHGIGPVHFGVSKAKAVAALRVHLGSPTWKGVNAGCGARYTEVEWGDLVAEFRLGTFTGYRYAVGGLPPRTFGGPGTGPTAVTPRLATANGVTLGTTLGHARAAYGGLKRRGAIIWQASNGIFFVDGSKRNPASPSDRMVEIKIGTCGDF